jgi:hypothetical protein
MKSATEDSDSKLDGGYIFVRLSTMASSTAATAVRDHISSFGFSGAGFLACYHLGVAHCLLQQGILPKAGSVRRQDDDDDRPPVVLAGVSAGALIAAAVSAGVHPDDGMDAVFQVAKRTRQAGRLDALQPGFSLIDVAEEYFSPLLRQAVQDDPDYFLQRIDHGRLLRIGLTDRRVFPPVGDNPKAFCYVDHYQSIDDVISACTLSSYVPGVTGPAWGSLDERHSAVVRATQHLRGMIAAGSVKQGATGKPIPPLSTMQQHSEGVRAGREICWDGGLVNNFPIVDEHTVIVTPLAGNFIHDSINPSLDYNLDESSSSSSTNDKRGSPSSRTLVYNDRVQIHLTTANARTVRCMVLSSDDNVLQERFMQGYDNASKFLDNRNLLSVYSQPCSSSAKTAV